GQGSVARGIFLPSTRDYWPGQESIFPRYNPEQAKAWLDAAGWKVGSDGVRAKEGQKLSLTFLGWVPEQEELATLLQAQLKTVGIDVQVRQAAISAYFPGLRRADHELWSLDTPYPSILELMHFWFWSGNIPSPNRANWNDKRTDELLTIARGARTDEARAKAVQEIQKIMADNQLVVPIWHRALIVATRAELKDFRPHGVYSGGFYKLLDARLDK
ncbi:MAG: ABC transporter substrate-binding protein, partial [Terriglobales bacterium]